ncbi:molybdopterin-dependent oxidoreductase [Geochorda subterranea]|uniref:Molybdopterin-dependent oxidoreductase n=1 Tax=Geochorda subterranea TaxID=3109564 RepID=A0ABZ1BLZ5_9FIRM|nr:molybdopterin-dependent oxidoreductase [Limnochorda sp. LNt]WRP13608.1 molybdopterin-dependent oxidoreductase [Limnochorda sp. LNt]
MLRAWQAELARAVAGEPGARACVIWDARGAWDGTAAAVGEAVLEVAQALEAAGAEVHVLVPGDQAQSRAAEAAGMLPGPGGLDTAGILRRAADGGIQVLYLVGANLLETFPDRSLVERALERTAFVVVQDLFVTATATMADLVLPALPSAMRAGTLVDLDGVTHHLEAALPPDGRGRADGEILAGLLAAVRADGRLEQGPAWGDRVAALSPERARGLWGVPRRAPAADTAMPPSGSAELGLRVVPLVRLYGGGGTVAFDPAFAPHRERLAVRLHPADAERLGVVDGAEVELRTAHGAIRAPVRVDPAMAAGLAGVPVAAAQGGAPQVTAWDDPLPAVTSLVVRAEVVEQRS